MMLLLLDFSPVGTSNSRLPLNLSVDEHELELRQMSQSGMTLTKLLSEQFDVEYYFVLDTMSPF